MEKKSSEIIVFGGGCFWCTEAVFMELDGVIEVTPGYAGGNIDNPTYEQVVMGKTGHAEVSKVEYDPNKISFDDLLTVFFATHDPTTLNRQGNDTGTQYRSIILYTSNEQREKAEKLIDDLSIDGEAVVTELQPLKKFYPAEEEHRRYYEKNQSRPYCQFVISPKLDKLKEKFYKLLKK